MNAAIVSFIVFGALFGALTFRQRHLFSEGAAAPDSRAPTAWARLGWMTLCSLLWPLLALTGAYGQWVRLRRAAQTRTQRDD